MGDYAFLSNFFSSSIYIDGKRYKTVEHAYQAHKTTSEGPHELIRAAHGPAEAKRLGRSVELRSDWDEVKVDLMRRFIWLKFENPILREMLLATGDAQLVENNYWNDTFWGVCRCKGLNMLGIILMETREKIRNLTEE